ncbi:MAG: metallophosphoesterase [Gammaproteobacteria bacterium]|nr:metallophosphoesterase [Gammaproteobacteria bacterium]
MQVKTSKSQQQKPEIPKSERFEDLGFVRKPMVKWFQPLRLFEIAAQVVISSIFSNYADKREFQAAAKQTKKLSYAKCDEIWFDFVADLGDGWDSTYTVAKILAAPELKLTTIDGQVETTQRGRFLVMGGDEVYPSASRDEYRDRTVAPYHAALPWVENGQPPHLYALPGNHDWYDGLTSFIRLFCQERWIGGWQTQQSVSYFAIELPHRWWFLGIDIQLGADIDKPQLDYFADIIQQMKSGDKVVFSTVKPVWISDHISGDKEIENFNYIEKQIREKGAEIFIHVAGDLHHYARYESENRMNHRITSGGGGAFLHGTHSLPDEITVSEVDGSKKYYAHDHTVYPKKSISKSLARDNLKFALRNKQMALFLGLLYALVAWVSQSSGISLNINFFAQLSQLQASVSFEFLAELSTLYASILRHSPGSLFLFALIIGGMVAFCEPFPNPDKNKARRAKIIVGSIHGLLHVLLMLGLIMAFVSINQSLIGLTIGTLPHTLLFAAEMIVIGGLLAGSLMGMYLYVTTRFMNFHTEAGFSSNTIEDYKNFLRFHINKKGELCIYAIGIDKVEKNWILNKNGSAGDSWFVAQSGRSAQDYVHLIEQPIKIRK